MESLDESRVRALLEGGRKIKAIQLVMEQTGLGLADAKAHVERMMEDSSGAVENAVPPDTVPEPHRWADPVRVRYLLEEGKKLEAIQYVRERMGLSLKDAKDFVEDPQFSGVMPREEREAYYYGPGGQSKRKANSSNITPKQALELAAIIIITLIVALFTLFAKW